MSIVYEGVTYSTHNDTPTLILSLIANSISNRVKDSITKKMLLTSPDTI